MTQKNWPVSEGRVLKFQPLIFGMYLWDVNIIYVVYWNRTYPCAVSRYNQAYLCFCSRSSATLTSHPSKLLIAVLRDNVNKTSFTRIQPGEGRNFFLVSKKQLSVWIYFKFIWQCRLVQLGPLSVRNATLPYNLDMLMVPELNVSMESIFWQAYFSRFWIKYLFVGIDYFSVSFSVFLKSRINFEIQDGGWRMAVVNFGNHT